MITIRHNLALVLVALAAPLAGCVTVSETNPSVPVAQHPKATIAPAGSMAVSPLTRIGVDSSGDPSIFLHLEFRDSGQKVIKAFGRVRVELYMTPAAGAPANSPDPQTLARSWDDDLADPVRNALAFDEMITRTYKINLGGLPPELVQWAKKEGPAGPDAPRLVVQFISSTATSKDEILKTTFTLTR